MKAVICTRYGPPEVLAIRDVPTPVPGDEQVLVRIIASAVNSGDVRVRSLAGEGFMKLLMRLMLGFSKPRKPILGTVYAGVVEQTGPRVTRFKSGDKVFGMTGFNFGAHASHIAVKESSFMSLMPQNATFAEAASLIFGGQTAIYFLQKAGIPQRSHPKILIIGATGSVGTSAVQIARHYGAEVMAVCSSAGQPLLQQLGVSDMILYDQTDFTQCRDRFDMVFDAVGKTTKQQCAYLLKSGGVYKTVGGMEYASESQEQMDLLKHLFELGHLKAIIDKSFPIDEVVAAQHYVDSGRKKGNVILEMST